MMVEPDNAVFELVPPEAMGSIPDTADVRLILPHVGAAPIPPLRRALFRPTSGRPARVVVPLAYTISPTAYDARPVPPDPTAIGVEKVLAPLMVCAPSVITNEESVPTSAIVYVREATGAGAVIVTILPAPRMS